MDRLCTIYCFLGILGFFPHPFSLELLFRNGFQTKALTVFHQFHSEAQYCNHRSHCTSTVPTPCSLTPPLHVSFHLLNELEGNRLEISSFSSIFGFSLGERDFCACRSSMPWQLGQLCVSEQQPVPLNYLLQLTWTCISLPFLPSHRGACCSTSKLERQMTQTINRTRWL